MIHSKTAEIFVALNEGCRGMFCRDKFDSFEKFPRELIGGPDSDSGHGPYSGVPFFSNIPLEGGL